MNDFKLTTPVAFIIFNRVDTAIQVFERIREAKPSKLLVIADGPRENKVNEAEKCQQCRDIIKKVDWECEVLTNYSDVNLGCKTRVSSGLDWVFENVEEAIILEDDCLPDVGFFRFCQEMLLRYRGQDRVMAISGTNILYGTEKISDSVEDESYYFSNVTGIWGWATWKRAWEKYDINMKSWPKIKESKILYNVFNDRTAEFWTKVFQDTYDGKISTWDYQWCYTFFENSVFSKMIVKKIKYPLKYPTCIEINEKYDRIINETFYSVPSIGEKIKNKLLNYIMK